MSNGKIALIIGILVLILVITWLPQFRFPLDCRVLITVVVSIEMLMVGLIIKRKVSV